MEWNGNFGMEYGRCRNRMEDFKNGMEDNLPYQFHTRFRALYLQKNTHRCRVVIKYYLLFLLHIENSYLLFYPRFSLILFKFLVFNLIVILFGVKACYFYYGKCSSWCEGKLVRLSLNHRQNLKDRALCLPPPNWKATNNKNDDTKPIHSVSFSILECNSTCVQWQLAIT